MKNAIEAEKAKSAKIENDLKLEIEKLKAEKEADVNSKLTLELDWQQRQIYLAQEEQVIINQDLKIALQKQYRDIYNLKAENEKMKSELEQLQSVISDMKTTKAMYRKINFDLEIERITLDVPKDAIIAKLNTVIDLQLSIDNLLSVGLDRKDAVIKYLKLKIEMVMSKQCSVCMQNEISVYFDPCGHSYCSSCLNTSYNCAKCKSVMRIHI